MRFVYLHFFHTHCVFETVRNRCLFTELMCCLYKTVRFSLASDILLLILMHKAFVRYWKLYFHLSSNSLSYRHNYYCRDLSRNVYTNFQIVLTSKKLLNLLSKRDYTKIKVTSQLNRAEDPHSEIANSFTSIYQRNKLEGDGSIREFLGVNPQPR